MQREAALGIGGQRIVISGPRGAEVTLGIDVQANRLEHVVGEQRAQERQREVLVDVVDAALGRRFALVVEQVTEVVQQRGGDQRGVRACGFGQRRTLQRMLELRHRLARVHAPALGVEQRADVGNGQGHRRLDSLTTAGNRSSRW